MPARIYPCKLHRLSYPVRSCKTRGAEQSPPARSRPASETAPAVYGRSVCRLFYDRDLAALITANYGSRSPQISGCGQAAETAAANEVYATKSRKEKKKEDTIKKTALPATLWMRSECSRNGEKKKICQFRASLSWSLSNRRSSNVVAHAKIFQVFRLLYRKACRARKINQCKDNIIMKRYV